MTSEQAVAQLDALWVAAQEADDAFQDALEAAYGKRAGDMRYQTSKLTSECKRLSAAFQAASDAWHAAYKMPYGDCEVTQ